MRTRRNVSSSDPVPSGHRSVLLHEAIELLAIEPHHTVLDATVGGAGHTKAIAALLSKEGTVVGLDRDAAAIERAKQALKEAKPHVRLTVGDFRYANTLLPKLGVQQLSDGRGFSFQTDEPLYMTYSTTPEAHEFTAQDIVNTWSEENIADVLYGWGEERFARRIARAIVAKRDTKRIETARELTELIESAVPSWYRYKKAHPATKTFQALRIAVNDELGAIRETLPALLEMMKPQGRIAVITFHSLEDRIVKRIFKEWVDAGKGTLATKKPVAPSTEEVSENPRARSAKLRVFSCN